MEKLYFENSKGDKLCGILSGDNKDTVIVLCHGFTTSKDNSTNTQLEQIFNKQGISTFRFDFYGHGESEGEFEDITTSEAVDDVLKAMEFVKNKGFLKIGLVGSSFGGMAALLAASKSNNLFVLALKCPVSDYLSKLIAGKNINLWKKQGYLDYYPEKNLKLKYSFYEDARKVDGYEAARRIKIPTLIVHGDADNTVPIEQSKKTASIIEDCKLEIIEGADHHFGNPGEFEKMLKLISEFIIKHSS